MIDDYKDAAQTLTRILKRCENESLSERDKGLIALEGNKLLHWIEAGCKQSARSIAMTQTPEQHMAKISAAIRALKEKKA